MNSRVNNKKPQKQKPVIRSPEGALIQKVLLLRHACQANWFQNPRVGRRYSRSSFYKSKRIPIYCGKCKRLTGKWNNDHFGPTSNGDQINMIHIFEQVLKAPCERCERNQAIALSTDGSPGWNLKMHLEAYDQRKRFRGGLPPRADQVKLEDQDGKLLPIS